ncbi:MAG: peptide chain release factor N(5)-glutamine methyltransferase [Candidatus Omnitrophica bacterium]|nr:peptide chain release factor N(5)-glutamine methyltransferase [Candidatus Omnitrophota bacterium]
MRELIRSAVEMLEGSQVPRPQWTVEQLLAHRAGCLPVDLYADPPELDGAAKVRFLADVAARAAGMPLQYLMGMAGFYGRDFVVGPGVFNPRPETEVLVEMALVRLGSRQEKFSAGGRTPRVVDVGTGSGAIAATLALERPGLAVRAVERSETALSFARRNIERLGAGVELVRGSLLEPFDAGSADLIVANLPYLDPQESAAWPRELHWEPWLALDGGPGGVDLIRELLSTAGPVLSPGGRVILEVGMGQVDRVCELAEERAFQVVHVTRDLAGIDRVIVLDAVKTAGGG